MTVKKDASKVHTQKELYSLKKWILLCSAIVICRILPHPPNVSLINGILCSACFYGFCFDRDTPPYEKFIRKFISKLLFSVSIVISLLVSDLFLNVIYSYGFLGWWTLFTYTGFLSINYIFNKVYSIISTGAANRKKKLALITGIFSTSLFYWIWTNFGAWMTSGLYGKTVSELLRCYILALPFLARSLLGDFVFCLIFLCFYKHVYATKSKHVAEIYTR